MATCHRQPFASPIPERGAKGDSIERVRRTWTWDLRKAGYAQLRERVAVEHTLAHVGRWQGRRARYRGVRKNLFDLRRCAVVHNLHVLAHSQALLAEFQVAA